MASETNDNHVAILEEALTRFVDECLQGNRPDVDKFVEQYPQCQDKLKGRLQDLDEIDSLLDSLVRTDESDFPNTMPEPDLVGRKVGNFEISEMIGRGGMGVVYLARDTKLKRSVAVKSIPAALAADSTARMRFRREAELLASLNHPNIAVIYDIFEHDEDRAYLVLEYVPGETLSERIARGPLKLQETLVIGRQIAEAVSAAHEKGVVHRDLKPGNIKITPDGRVKVLDFGLAKTTVRDKIIDTTTTQLGRVMGTPAYMSPEQARGKTTDRRTDIWSFGCIVYRMLTGRLPFEGDTAADILANILQTDPDWEALPESTPQTIRVLLRQCLEKDPDRRLGDIANATVAMSETLSRPVTRRSMPIPVKLRRIAVIIGVAAIIVLSGLAVWFGSDRKNKRLVVLPFVNLGSAEDQQLVDGITGEMIASLTSVPRLSVTSRYSAMQYKNRESSVRRIAKDLRVEYVLDGTIKWRQSSDPNGPVRVVLSVYLSKATDDRNLWTKDYDRDESEVSGVPSEVAVAVAQALNITLPESDRQTLLATKPTESPEAYTCYLKGNEYYNRSVDYYHRNARSPQDNFSIAVPMYEEAVKLDPNFALAYAKLSMAHVWTYWRGYDRSKKRLASAKKAVDEALKLDRYLPEARLALGQYYYYGGFDREHFDLALKEFAIAHRSQPNNGDALAFIGFVQRRQGKRKQALANIRKSAELNPLSSHRALHTAITLQNLERFSEAESWYERAIKLSPDLPAPYIEKAWLYVLSQGKTERARTVLEEARQEIESDEYAQIIPSLIGFDILDRKYQDALERISPESEDVNDMDLTCAMQHALLYWYVKEEESSKRCYARARDILEPKIPNRQEDAEFQSLLGEVYAGLDRKDRAIEAGRRGVELQPMDEYAAMGSWRIKDLARIYMMVGEYEAAIDQLEILRRSHPGKYGIGGGLSITQLRLDSIWNPLRENPRFKKLVE